MQKNTDPSQWLEARLQVAPEHAELLMAELSFFEPLGSYEDLPLDATDDIKSSVTVIAFFADHPDKSPQIFSDSLKNTLKTPCEILSVKRIPLSDWATAWKKYFKPMQIAPGIVICPSWEEYIKTKNEKVITMDPGMAFGTGQHDTTRFCSELIVELKKNNPDVNSLLDVGCGSGILCLIAATVGIVQVTGIDIDAASIETCRENLEKNPELKNITYHITDGTLHELDNKKFDVVVANIFAETVCELKSTLLQHLNPGGYLIVSGVISGSDPLIRENFSDLPLVAERHSQDWHAYIFQKK